MAVEMVDDPAIRLTRAEAMRRVTAEHIDGVLHPQFADRRRPRCSPRVSAPRPARRSGGRASAPTTRPPQPPGGEHVILVRNETSPEDVHGMLAAEGILTARGGLVCHAAVVARGWGKPAVVGAEAAAASAGGQLSGSATRSCDEGDVISIDGTTGAVVLGAVPLTAPEPRRSSRRSSSGPTRSAAAASACAPTPTTGADAANARRLGAEGIGLCRTEHMFLGEDRLPIVRRMILAATEEDETAALEELRVAQRADFLEILEAMDGLPVTVRLLDPPLHEFLPDVEELAVKEATEGLTDEEPELLDAARSGASRTRCSGRAACASASSSPACTRCRSGP